MHLHFLGICGTFMGSLALLARELGHEVSGCDANVYPPMSTQLEEQGISIHQGYDSAQFATKPDLVIIGNALSRGNEAVEYVLNQQLPYCSGPDWLSRHLLHKRWVLAVSGTHGKTTTSSMLAWILEYAGYAPGFLIGGLPGNFATSARLGESDFFVIEADEYDTAFFDKRSKFLHYHPRTLVINNLEFDHADIFEDLAAIQKQFAHLLRIVPSQGQVIYPEASAAIREVLNKGVWSESMPLQGNADSEQAGWRFCLQEKDGSHFELIRQDSEGKEERHSVKWPLLGEHNVQNAMAAAAAAHHVGVPLRQSCEALASFRNVKRRLEELVTLSTPSGNSLTLFDDFAHHPSAIKVTLNALRERFPDDLLLAVLEPRSNTMKMGVHGKQMAEATAQADKALWFVGDYPDLARHVDGGKNLCMNNLETLEHSLREMIRDSERNVRVVIMSNGGFYGFQQGLLARLRKEMSDA